MIQTLGDHVLIKKDKVEDDEKTTTYGLYIATSDFEQELPRGIVMSKGAGVPDTIEVGDHVVFATNIGAEVEEDGEEYLIMVYQYLYGKVV